jgi:hypothetical protein
MIDLVIYVWVFLFTCLIAWFLLLQPKLGRFYLDVRKNFNDAFEACRPSFFLAKYNEQLVFLIFMYKKAYRSAENSLIREQGEKYRSYILLNAVATSVFFIVTLMILIFGWKGLI